MQDARHIEGAVHGVHISARAAHPESLVLTTHSSNYEHEKHAQPGKQTQRALTCEPTEMVLPSKSFNVALRPLTRSTASSSHRLCFLFDRLHHTTDQYVSAAAAAAAAAPPPDAGALGSARRAVPIFGALILLPPLATAASGPRVGGLNLNRFGPDTTAVLAAPSARWEEKKKRKGGKREEGKEKKMRGRRLAELPAPRDLLIHA